MNDDDETFKTSGKYSIVQYLNCTGIVCRWVWVDGCEVRPCDPCARVRPCVPCVPCVSRLPPGVFLPVLDAARVGVSAKGSVMSSTAVLSVNSGKGENKEGRRQPSPAPPEHHPCRAYPNLQQPAQRR